MKFKKSLSLLGLMLLLCVKSYAQTEKYLIEAWVTSADRTSLLTKQLDTVAFSDKEVSSDYPIVVDNRQHFQEIEGFGFALTGGSAQHLMQMNEQARANLLTELFSEAEFSVRFNYIRLTIGASDLNSFVFSYDDVKKGETDIALKKFTLSQDLIDVVPVMKEILKINPDIKIMASPWSAPTWMKTNNNIKGGALLPKYYEVYARYFVKYIQYMAQYQIPIHAITIQNEPLNSGNTPSMQWFYNQQADFIKNHLGPTLEKAQLKVDIMLFDHNADRIDYPLALLMDPEVDKYVSGSAFHHYRGDLSALSQLHMARPDKDIYFTEQMVVDWDREKSLQIASKVSRMIIGTTRNWSKNVILWNLAADPNDDPHTDNGGCPFCQGALTIEGDQVNRNLAYYTIAHASKFVAPGSFRIASTALGDQVVTLTADEENPTVKRAAVIENVDVLPNVAFQTTDGYIVLIVTNDTFDRTAFKIQYQGKTTEVKLAPGSVGTYKWPMNYVK